MQKLEKHDKLGNYNNWPLSTVLTKKMTYIYETQLCKKTFMAICLKRPNLKIKDQYVKLGPSYNCSSTERTREIIKVQGKSLKFESNNVTINHL